MSEMGAPMGGDVKAGGQRWILALNTATDALSVGVVPVGDPSAGSLGVGTRSAVEILVDPPAGRSGHSERLLPLVDTAVRMAGMVPAELDGVAVVAGPGGFTGVRTGLAVAKSIAQVLSIPVCGVDTLEALAAGCGACTRIAALLDARRGDVFAAVYVHEAGRLTCQQGPTLVALDEFLERLPPGEPIAFVGEGALRHEERLLAHPGAVALPPQSHAIRPVTVARLAAPSLLSRTGDPLTLLPRYQRAPTMAPDWVASR